MTSGINNTNISLTSVKQEIISSDEEEDTETNQVNNTIPGSSLDEPAQESQAQQHHDYQPSSSGSSHIQVSVQRNEISSTTAREGDLELQHLGVEAYDQQTYEEGVFEQVDKAIDGADNSRNAQSSTQQQPSKINDLIRLIHDQGDENPDEQVESSDRDEQVLQLTRLERLNRNIEVEKVKSNLTENSIKSLPRIPRLSARVKVEPDRDLDQNQSATYQPEPVPYQPSKPTSSSSSVHVKPEPVESREEPISDSGESSKSEYNPGEEDQSSSEIDEFNDDIDFETDDELGAPEQDRPIDVKRVRSRKKSKIEDDGDFGCYERRIMAHIKSKAKARLENIAEDGTESKNLDELLTIEGNLQIPKEMWRNLFEHQRTGVRWLWELHQLGTGGILGDEMGLGKTIQMIAFLTALKSSNIANAHKGYEHLGPTVLVCPATVMQQWLLEFRKWWPPFRVAILHSTGTFSGNRKNLVQAINKSKGVLIVSYPGVVIYQDYLHSFDWHYAILDEGHKIRNPDAQVTLACKRFRTPHRIILSGSPVQNNLRELWSIFDFIYPGKLGTLPVFMEQFATPITQGGYANATDIQVQIAYKCSCVLRDTIKPFLLRRTKAEVNHKLKLPDRSEQVLFCKLTDKQRKLYQHYLESPTVRDIKRGFCQIFVGLIELRKICNHPDLFDSTDCGDQIKQLKKIQQVKHPEFFSDDETFGHYSKSGKMVVVDALLKLWKKQNHKVLLFTQSRQMLKIFKSYLDERNYRNMIMDGSTPIGMRQTMIREFNRNEEIFVFLLTTRVGGVGINLTGANRIIIYDPDWNPATDIQARERAWRIGQERHVIIYRLLTTGTIEEKIYHRQVFKLYLTNRVLKNAQQKRFFKTNDLHELFTLGDNDKNIETKALFDDSLQINPESIKKAKSQSKLRKKSKRDKKASKQSSSEELNVSAQSFSEEKLQAMRDRAKRISQMISLKYGPQAQGGQSEQESSISEPCLPDCVSEFKKVKLEPGVSATGPTIPEKSKLSLPEPTQSHKSKSSSKTKDGSSKSSRSSKQRVDYLVKQDIYKPNIDEDDGDKPDPRYKKDDYILERLFKNSNIFGALKHDKIETDSTADYKVVESEAEKVARDAIRALRQSRRLCLDSSSGIPNWTGRNGQVAAKARLVPKNKSRAMLIGKPTSSTNNSESLLSSIKKRNQSNPIAIARSTFQVSSLDSDEEERDKDFEGKADGTGAEDMADKIREFVLFKGARNCEAQTDEILEFFKNNFKPDKTAVFKALLYKMCEFHRRGDKGFWTLKSEFRDI